MNFTRRLARDRAGNIDRRGVSVLMFQYWSATPKRCGLVIQAGNPDILLERLKAYLE